MIEFALQTPDEHSQCATAPALQAIDATRVWLEKAVIGLNLCPFAKAVHVKQQIRYAVSDACDSDTLAQDLMTELMHLAATDKEIVDTTLLIHPAVLDGFSDYNDFLEVADAIVNALGLAGQIQIASFHPHYRFEGSVDDDIENYTNRSPFPMLHLLRESSIERAVAAFPDAATIYDTNMATLRRIGLQGWLNLFDNSRLQTKK